MNELWPRALLLPSEWQGCKVRQRPIPQRRGEVVSMLWVRVQALWHHALHLGLRLKEEVGTKALLLTGEPRVDLLPPVAGWAIPLLTDDRLSLTANWLFRRQLLD